MEEKAVFDRSLIIDVRVRRIGKTVSVRFPTDEEVLQRQRKVCTIQKRDDTVEHQGMDQANADLLELIRQGGDVIDEPEEATLIIEAVLKAAVEEEGTRLSDSATIHVRTFGGILTEHELKIPSIHEERKHKKAVSCYIKRPYGVYELKTNLAVIKEFYDGLFRNVSGYSENTKEAVPLTHKLSAVVELLRLIHAEDEEEDPANFQERMPASAGRTLTASKAQASEQSSTGSSEKPNSAITKAPPAQTRSRSATNPAN